MIDTVGLNDRTWLDTAGLHQDVEQSSGSLSVKPGDHLMEYSCDENNLDRDQGHLRPGPTVVPFNQPQTK